MHIPLEEKIFALNNVDKFIFIMTNILMKFWLSITLVMISPFYLYAKTTTILIDCSGSMEGMSQVRKTKSMHKVSLELTMFLTRLQNDTICIVPFTDIPLGKYIVTEYCEDVKNHLNSILCPVKGNTNVEKALAYLRNKDYGEKLPNRIVIISDGLHNEGVSYERLFNEISILNKEIDGNFYFLLLDNKDKKNQLVDFFSKTRGLYLIKSLSEMSDIESISKTTVQQEDKNVKAHVNTSNLSKADENLKWQNIPFLRLILILLLLIVVYGIVKCFFLPLYALHKMSSAGAIQKAIFTLYNFPRPLFYFVYNHLPSKMTDYLTQNMPKYEDYCRGKVLDIRNKETLKMFREQTGKDMVYKNGEPDFTPAAKYKVKLIGGLNRNIPKGSDVRKKVSIAQENAARQMLGEQKGRKIIAGYVGKNPKDVTYEDFTCWKDDAKNIGKPNHTPLTPHETIDGMYIQWIPKKYHDVSWGGISHNGGVSMLKSIRNHFNLNV